MKTSKITLVIITLIFAIGLSSCTVEYRARHPHYYRNPGDREHDLRY